jgi:starch phosphorylase
MRCAQDRAQADSPFVYSAAVPTARAADDFTARVVPHHPGASVPLEAPYILWQR